MVKQQNKFLILILCFLHKMRFTVVYFSDMHRCLQLQKSAHPKEHKCVPLSCLWEKELWVQFCWVFKTLLYIRKGITAVLSYSNNLPFCRLCWVLLDRSYMLLNYCHAGGIIPRVNEFKLEIHLDKHSSWSSIDNEATKLLCILPSWILKISKDKMQDFWDLN